MLNFVPDQLREASAQTLNIPHINTEEDYELALKRIDELVDNYETNKKLIELLAISIEGWEDKADEFATFNKAVVGIARDHCIENANEPIPSGSDRPELDSTHYVSKLLHVAKDKN